MILARHSVRGYLLRLERATRRPQGPGINDFSKVHRALFLLVFAPCAATAARHTAARHWGRRSAESPAKTWLRAPSRIADAACTSCSSPCSRHGWALPPPKPSKCTAALGLTSLIWVMASSAHSLRIAGRLSVAATLPSLRRAAQSVMAAA